MVPAFDENSRDANGYETNRCTDKLEGYADDGTILAKVTEEVFPRIRLILEQFKDLSGLRCNIDKSMVLPIGYENDNVPALIADSGFKVVNRVTILGTEITANTDDLVNNFDKVIQKVALRAELRWPKLLCFLKLVIWVPSFALRRHKSIYYRS
jgi:hypothetical protein